jgi:hypothetical protein
MGGWARGPGHSLPHPELPENAASETQEAAAARGRHRGFSSKLQKRDYE